MRPKSWVDQKVRATLEIPDGKVFSGVFYMTKALEEDEMIGVTKDSKFMIFIADALLQPDSAEVGPIALTGEGTAKLRIEEHNPRGV